MGRRLSIGQEKFAQGVQHMTDRDAVVHAYPTAVTWATKSLDRRAGQLRAHAGVAARIAELQEANLARNQITADRVVQELAAVGFADATRYWEQEGDEIRLKPLNTWGPNERASVQSIKVKLLNTKTRGKAGPVGRVLEVELKLHSKVAALEKLGQHLGIFQSVQTEPFTVRVEYLPKRDDG